MKFSFRRRRRRYFLLGEITLENLLLLLLMICCQQVCGQQFDDNDDSWEFMPHEFGYDTQLDNCPEDRHLLEPCHCNQTNRLVICSGSQFNKPITLRYIFQETFQTLRESIVLRNKNKLNAISGLSYGRLSVANTPLESLVNNSFERFTFVSIVVRDNYYLSELEPETFGPESVNVTRTLKFDNNPKLGLGETSMRSLFAVISQFHQLQRLYIHRSGLTYIPSDAFSSERATTNNNRLELISLTDNRLKTIQSNAFGGLRSLRYLFLANNQLERLETNSLRLRSGPEQCSSQLAFDQLYFNLDLINNRLDPQSFHPGTFNIDCSIEIDLSNNSIDYLPENCFKSLFLHHVKLVLFANPVQCEHCNMSWLLRGRYCPDFWSTLSYHSLLNWPCSSALGLRNFLDRCSPYRERLPSLRSTTYDQLSTSSSSSSSSRLQISLLDQQLDWYLSHYPNDLNESNPHLLPCPGSSDSESVQSSNSKSMLSSSKNQFDQNDLYVAMLTADDGSSAIWPDSNRYQNPLLPSYSSQLWLILFWLMTAAAASNFTCHILPLFLVF